MSGAFWFGVVIGYVTYRTLKRKQDTGLSDIAAVVAAVGSGAILPLFPAGTQSFDSYATGLATGFFVYLALSVVLAKAMGGSAVTVILGEDAEQLPPASPER